MKKIKKIKSERKELSGKVNSKLNFISICQQPVTLLKLVSSNSSNQSQMLPKLETYSQLPEIMKTNNADFLSIPLTNMLFQSTPTKEMTHIIVFLLKVLLKEFGNFVPMLTLVESQFLKLLNGIKNSKRPMLSLVKMVKEFWVLLSIIFLKKNILKISSLILKRKTSNLSNNASSVFFHLLILQEMLFLMLS